MTELIEDIKPTAIASAYVAKPFDEALTDLRTKGYEIISTAENAKLRVSQGIDSFVSKNGNYTREGIIYTPNKTPIIVRISPILLAPAEATQAHRNGQEFYPNEIQLSQSMGQSTDSIKFPDRYIKIPTNRFSEEALTIFLFGGEANARAYGKFLKSVGIEDIPVYAIDKSHVDKQDKPFARQLWFGRLVDGSRSSLNGNNRNLNNSNRVREMTSDRGFNS